MPATAMTSPLRGLIACLLAVAACAPATAALDLSVDLGATDNVMRTPWTPERKADRFLDLGLQASGFTLRSQRFASASLIAVNARRYSDYPRLNRDEFTLGGRLIYRHRPALFAPSVSLGAELGLDRAATAQRDARHWRLSLRLDQSLTTRIAYRASLLARGREAGDPVFSGSGQALEGQLDWSWRPRRRLYLSIGLDTGDQVFSSAWQNPSLMNEARRHSPDAAFGVGVRAYRYDADRQRAALGLHQGLGPQASLDGLIECARSELYPGSDYRDCQARLGLFWRLSP